MPITHPFVSSKSDGADATLVQPSDWNDAHAITAELDIPSISTPSAPGSGKSRLFSEDIAGRPMLAQRNSLTPRNWLQPHFGFSNISMLLPATGTAPALMGIPNNATGTASHPALASTNLRTQMRRTNYVSSTTASAGCGTRSNQTMCWRGNAAGYGGFFFNARIALSAVPSSVSNAFVGLRATTAVIAAGTEPSALVNILGFGFDRTETTWRFYNNDGSGPATEADLGSNFPVDDTSVFDFSIFCPANGSTIYYEAANLGTGDIDAGSVTTDLPSSTTFLSVHVYMSMNSGSTAVGIDMGRLYLESDV